MRRCDNGHYFDADRHPMCPFCGPELSEMGETYAVVPQRPGGSQDESAPSESSLPSIRPSTTPSHSSAPLQKETVAYWGHADFDPIVGWLVCVDGTGKGKDYRVRRGNNTIGRDRSMDIVLDDPGVARRRQAIIAYDKRTNTFMIKEGESRGLVYLNSVPVAGSQPLAPWDRLEFGESSTQYLFVPFVGEQFQWKVDEVESVD